MSEWLKTWNVAVGDRLWVRLVQQPNVWYRGVVKEIWWRGSRREQISSDYAATVTLQCKVEHHSDEHRPVRLKRCKGVQTGWDEIARERPMKPNGT